jgi:S1-C subfamily serine protease
MIALALALLIQEGDTLYERASRASVEVYTSGRLNGSGWIADPKGYAVTAAHVVWKKKGKLEVLAEGKRVKADIAAVDRGHDLALLKLPVRKEPYPALPLAPRMPAPPKEIHLFGAPIFRHGVLLTGRVARASPTFEYLGDQVCAVRIFHVSGPSPKGTSGGCWMDGEGRAVGAQSGMMIVKNAPRGIAYVSPLEAIRRLVTTRRSARTADVGIAVEEIGEQPVGKFPEGTEGVVAAAGKALKKGTLIVSVDGQKVTSRDGFYSLIRAKKPGNEVKLELAGGKSVKVTVFCLEEQD